MVLALKVQISLNDFCQNVIIQLSLFQWCRKGVCKTIERHKNPSVENQKLIVPKKIDGQWSNWSSYGACTCESTGLRGVKIATRSCTKPRPKNGGRDCLGPTKKGYD